MKTTTIQQRLAFRRRIIEKLYAAYEALVSGGVKAYMIDDRQLTKLDLPDLKREIDRIEAEIDDLEAQLNGARRKIVGVIPL